MGHRPSFEDLPLRSGDPPYSAWGLYGPDDQLGTLNLLTQEVTKEAVKEVQTGVRVGLDQPVDYLSPPPHKRLGVKHKIIHKAPRAVHDDTIEMNTQISTQWDGLRHYAYQEPKLFYNGTKVEELSGPNATTKLGIDAWCRQGIVGRGVLLDYYRWAQSNSKPYDVLGDYAISQEELVEVARSQLVQIKPGNILLIRTGFTVGYDALTTQQKEEWSEMPQMKHVGVQASIKMTRWLWENKISACASDAPAFERIPKDPSGLDGLMLHEVLLSGWGLPIGELWNLERLSEECHRTGRYSFFLTSMPLNIPGGNTLMRAGYKVQLVNVYYSIG